MSETTWTDALTGSGNLDGSPVGSASDRIWSARSGSWTRSSTGATTTAGASANPFVTTDVLTGDFDAQTDTYSGAGGGDALYFRCSDASNWWRLRNRYVSVTTPGSWYGTGWYTVGGAFSTSQPNGTYITAYQHGVPTSKTVVSAGLGQVWDQDVAQGPSSTSTYYYRVLDKSVAGTVTQVALRTATSFGTLRVVTSGSVITIYAADGTTVDTTITDTFNQAASQVGVGLGGDDSSGYASALTDFSVSIDTPITAPTALSPVNAVDVDIAAATIVVQSNFVASDPATSIDIQIKQGGGDWVETDDAFTQVEGSTAQWAYTIPQADLTAGTQVEAQFRATDSLGNTTGWSPSLFLTPRTKPNAPTYVSPDAGSTVVASDIATVDFGTDSTARQARRVADDGSGNADESRVYQASLTITGPDDDGNYLLTGDGSVHPAGDEHIQSRRQTPAGGTLWSDWDDADLAVTMELAAPFIPLVAVVQPAGTATNVFTITCPPPDADHTDAIRVDIYRGGVRVAKPDVADNTVTWTDDIPGTASDYRFVAVAANGAQASFG